LAQPLHVPPSSPQKLALPVVRKQNPLVLHVTSIRQLSDVAAQPPRWWARHFFLPLRRSQMLEQH
jgi:hypothetical protein